MGFVYYWVWQAGVGVSTYFFFPRYSLFSLPFASREYLFLCSFSFMGFLLGNRILWCNISSKSDSLKYVFWLFISFPLSLLYTIYYITKGLSFIVIIITASFSVLNTVQYKRETTVIGCGGTFVGKYAFCEVSSFFFSLLFLFFNNLLTLCMCLTLKRSHKQNTIHLRTITTTTTPHRNVIAWRTNWRIQLDLAWFTLLFGLNAFRAFHYCYFVVVYPRCSLR